MALIAYQVESKQRGEFNIPSFSVNSVQRRISLMSEYIKDQVIDQMKSTSSFALQLDEYTDVLSFPVLTAFVRYIYNDEFKNEFLCIINLLPRTREEDIYQTIDTVFKTNDIKWEPLRGLCVGVASVMLGHRSGVCAYVQSVAPNCIFALLIDLIFSDTRDSR